MEWAIQIVYYGLAALYGAWWYRVRGGAYDEYEFKAPWRLLGSTAIRIYYATAMTFLIWLVHGIGIWVALGTIGCLWLGVVFGWSKWMTAGYESGEPLRDISMMSLRGLVVTVPAGILLYMSGLSVGLSFGLCGVGMGLCYAAGWWIKWPWWDKDPLARAEIIFGAWLGLFVLI